MLGKGFLGRRRLLATTAAAIGATAVAAPAVVRAQQILRSSKASYSLRMLTLDLRQGSITYATSSFLLKKLSQMNMSMPDRNTPQSGWV